MSEFEINQRNGDPSIREIFKQSYFLSQGEPTLQALLFTWLKIENQIQPSQIEGVYPDWLKDFKAPRLHSVTGQESTDFAWEDVSKQWLSFHETIIGEADTDYTSTLTSIFEKIVNNDLIYQFEKRPGRTKGAQFEPDGAEDPHRSHLRLFVLNDGFLSLPFSKLLKELKPFAKRYSGLNSENIKTDTHTQPIDGSSRAHLYTWTESLEIDDKMKDLIKSWERKHPGHSFFRK